MQHVDLEGIDPWKSKTFITR